MERIKAAINPRDVWLRTVWSHEDITWGGVDRSLLCIEYLGDVAEDSSRVVVSGAIIIIFGHDGVIVVVVCKRIRGPFLIALTAYTCIQVVVKIYATVLVVPRATHVAFANNCSRDRCVRGNDF
jgi:hypothetical protein